MLNLRKLYGKTIHLWQVVPVSRDQIDVSCRAYDEHPDLPLGPPRYVFPRPSTRIEPRTDS
jgi:hypothetical protein